MSARRPLQSRMRQALGDWLRGYLESRNLSQRELADLVGRKETFISMILLGQRKPARKDIQRWAVVLGLTEEERADFMELAGLSYCPEWVVREYLRMKAQLRGEPQ